MKLPDYWLSRPAFALGGSTIERLEDIYTRCISHGSGAWIEDPLPVPKWQFLCWLTDTKGLLLHGTGDPDIGEFEPRAPYDRSNDDFSKQKAVFAASDGIWPMFYAIIDRANYRMSILNAALRFEFPSGELSDTRYFFSITRSVLARRPWRAGVVYVIDRAGFTMQPRYRLGGWTVHDPHWANPEPVRPLAKIRVQALDFPLLDQIRGHDDETVAERSAKAPESFPWLDDSL